MNNVYTLWLREMIRFSRSKSRIVASIASPFFWLLFIGTGLGSSFSLGNVNYIDYIAPGIISMILLFTSMFFGISVLWDRQFGFLKEILVSPISRTTVIIGKTLGGATIAVINGILMLVIAVFVNNANLILTIDSISLSILFMILTSICFVTFGILIASKMRSMEGFQMIMSFFILPVFFLSGALYPLKNVPLWMKEIAYINPLTYSVDGLRGVLLGINNMPILTNALVLAGFCVLFLLAGRYVFDNQ